MKQALTIAGSDSCGGAGVQADLKTFAAFGVYGSSVITAITAQNTRGVQHVWPVPLDAFEHQLDAVMQDMAPEFWKTGMLVDEERVLLLAHKVRQYRPESLVVDPVLVSSSGRRLLSRKAQELLRAELFPAVTLLTPNVPEAEVLSGCLISTLDDMKQAAERLLEQGVQAVVIKGGHLSNSTSSQDLLATVEGMEVFTQERVLGSSPHGTGCTFASAVTALLARGTSLPDAVEQSQRYLRSQIEAAQSFRLGQGTLLMPHAPASGMTLSAASTVPLTGEDE